MAGHLTFFHPLAPCQCSRQLSQLGNSTRVKSAKSFNREGQEDDALKAASFCRVLDFPLVGLVESSTCLCCSTLDIGRRERADHGNIYGTIFAVDPAADCHISRTSNGSRQQILLLLGRRQVCSDVEFGKAADSLSVLSLSCAKPPSVNYESSCVLFGKNVPDPCRASKR